jgi:hypothetical protein
VAAVLLPKAAADLATVRGLAMLPRQMRHGFQLMLQAWLHASRATLQGQSLTFQDQLGRSPYL